MADDGREVGYIKLHRSIESSVDFVGLRPDQAWVAVRILQLANYKQGVMRFRTQAIPVARGEVGHTIESIAQRTGATRKVVRTTIDRLISSGFLGTRTGTVAGTAYRILIVRNYERFQGDDDESGTVTGTVAGHDRATTGHQEKEGKKEKKERKKRRSRVRPRRPCPCRCPPSAPRAPSRRLTRCSGSGTRRRPGPASRRAAAATRCGRRSAPA